MRRGIVTLALLSICGCVGDPAAGFATAAKDNERIVTHAAPGIQSLVTATIRGKVIARNLPGLMVAASIPDDPIPPLKAIDPVPVLGGGFTFNLPPQEKLESDISVATHELWELRLFLDRNGNGKYDLHQPANTQQKQDYTLPTFEKWRLGYKGFAGASKFTFLPTRDFVKGWYVVEAPSFRPRSMHQDFSRSFDLSDTAFIHAIGNRIPGK